ncbi:MAG: hypothetical protein WCS85_00855 [Candidatus Peribacteraceae bacterium]
MPDREIIVLFRREEESWMLFGKRVTEADGDVVIVLSATDAVLALREEEKFGHFLDACSGSARRVRIAVRSEQVRERIRRKGFRVIATTKQLRTVLAELTQSEEALRIFSPSLWRQKWRTRLQSAGLLSVPRLRIVILIVLSLLLFLFVVLRLLPSAEVIVTPRGDMAVQTANIFLLQGSGSSSLSLAPHVRTLLLIPIDVHLRRSLVFDQISKQFIGTNAKVPMTIINRTADIVSLKKGTRLRNQAGMVFRIQRFAEVAGGGTETVPAVADEIDTYGEIIGERGNVPAGVRWEIPGLSEEERKSIYAENRAPAQGGTTAYKNALQKSDLDIARKRLEQQLLAEAKKEVEERMQSLNLTAGMTLRLLNNDQLVKATYTGFVLPLDQLNQPVSSITVEGGLEFRMLVYDAQRVLDLISGELIARIPPEKKLLSDTVSLKQLDVRIFDYADDLSWLKATAELSATEQYVLDPLTPSGARFARTVREKITSMTVSEAVRFVKNLPEVEKVKIRMWPPWSSVLPAIPSNISIVTQ